MLGFCIGGGKAPDQVLRTYCAYCGWCDWYDQHIVLSFFCDKNMLYNLKNQIKMFFLKIHRFDRYDKGEGAGSHVFLHSTHSLTWIWSNMGCHALDRGCRIPACRDRWASVSNPTECRPWI